MPYDAAHAAYRLILQREAESVWARALLARCQGTDRQLERAAWAGGVHLTSGTAPERQKAA